MTVVGFSPAAGRLFIDSDDQKGAPITAVMSVIVPVMTIAIGVLVIATAIASVIPARRAASIDPVRALRIE
jgi:ABC-type lipoprotein release transport system permease subunit